MSSVSKEHYLGYNRQLDGLRAIAIGAVLWEHWMYFIKIPHFSPGQFGVYLFFTISGYLITGILLKAKQEDIPKTTLFKNFYVRRFLRIFPLYYLFLFVLLAIKFEETREPFIWHLLYLSNFYDIAIGSAKVTSHFWTLAVEEQFYLFWPLLIVFTPNKYLRPLIIIMILIVPILYVYFTAVHIPQLYLQITPIGLLHILGTGALLCFINHNKIKDLQLIFLLLICGTAFYLPRMLSINNPYTEFFLAPFFGSLVLFVIRGIKGKAGILLSNQLVVYLGRISYGIYIIHFLVAESLRDVFVHYGYEFHKVFGILQLPVMFLATVIVASFLYYSYEMPINKFKRYFNYKIDEKEPIKREMAETSF